VFNKTYQYSKNEFSTNISTVSKNESSTKYQHSKNELSTKYQYSKNEFRTKYQHSKNEFSTKYQHSKNEPSTKYQHSKNECSRKYQSINTCASDTWLRLKNNATSVSGRGTAVGSGRKAPSLRCGGGEGREGRNTGISICNANMQTCKNIQNMQIYEYKYINTHIFRGTEGEGGGHREVEGE
jgi:hypothetical protein